MFCLGYPQRLIAPAIHTRRLAVLAAVGLWVLAPGVASAHAHLVQADPAPDAVITRAPAVASFIFDEALNPALTRVRLTDSAGRRIAMGGHLAPGHNGELWRLSLPRLGAGVYSVFWTSESATDGHIMSSFYTFRVAAGGAAGGMAAVPSTMPGMAASGPGIDAQALTISLFIWIGLIAQALWLGALIVDLAVLGPARHADGAAEARLAWAAAPRLWTLVRLSPPVALLALLGQVVCLAFARTGGD